MSVVTSPTLCLRRLIVADGPAIAHVIRQISAEYGLIASKGYTVVDPSLDGLYQIYSQPSHAYQVVEYEGGVVGGSGVAPLAGSESDICELQKMCFLPIIHGKRLAEELALMAVEQAREVGFKCCYLEATVSLKEVIAFYEHLGFEHIDYTFGCTGHVDRKVRMLHKL